MKKSKTKSKKKNIIIVLLLIISILLILLILKVLNSKDKNLDKKLVVKDELTIEIDEGLPNNKDYFINYENEVIEAVKIYNKDVEVKDISIGVYNVEIITENTTYNSILNVVDTKKPILKLKEVTIENGTVYNVDSFIDSCVDNSNSECKLEFKEEKMASFTIDGEYEIVIVAKDESNNEVEENTKLIIKKKEVINNNTNNNVNRSVNTNNINNKPDNHINNVVESKAEENTNKVDTTNNSNSSANTSSTISSTSISEVEIKTHNVKLIMDDGRNITFIGVRTNSKIPKNVETTKEGREFKEWQLDGKTFDINTPITKDIELKAVYNEVPIITYKYGVKISTINGRSTYDYTTFSGTTNDLKPEAASVSSSNYGIYNELLGYVNELRKSEGKESLVLDNVLSQAATLRAIEIAWANKFSHTRPNGSSCFSVISEFGIYTSNYGENIAGWQTTPKMAFDEWNASSGHHANMVNESFTKIGIGKYTLNGANYWVQLFVR